MNRSRIIHVIAGLATLALVIGCAGSPPIGDETGMIRATGFGTSNKPDAQGQLMARRAALMDAYRNLYEYARGVQITSETVVKDYITESDWMSSATGGRLQGVRVTDTRYLPDGTVEVDVEMSVKMLKALCKR